MVDDVLLFRHNKTPTSIPIGPQPRHTPDGPIPFVESDSYVGPYDGFSLQKSNEYGTGYHIDHYKP